jgi:hypothetical protein
VKISGDKMKKYNFLFKPLFFIFSLVFATWLVLYIEKISPSDFGRYEYLFNSEPKPLPKELKIQNPLIYNTKQLSLSRKLSALRQAELKKLCFDYKAGLIDSSGLDQQLEIILKSTEEFPVKQVP